MALSSLQRFILQTAVQNIDSELLDALDAIPEPEPVDPQVTARRLAAITAALRTGQADDVPDDKPSKPLTPHLYTSEVMVGYYGLTAYLASSAWRKWYQLERMEYLVDDYTPRTDDGASGLRLTRWLDGEPKRYKIVTTVYSEVPDDVECTAPHQVRHRTVLNYNAPPARTRLLFASIRRSYQRLAERGLLYRQSDFNKANAARMYQAGVYLTQAGYDLAVCLV